MVTSFGSYGYEELPPDNQGVIKMRTHGQLRLWLIPRGSLSALQRDLGNLQFPGVYILIDSTKQNVYIGQSDDLTNRLRGHDQKPPQEEVNNWNEALIVTDGRPISLSDFADAALRQTLEGALIAQFQGSEAFFKPVNRQSGKLSPSIWQGQRFEQLWGEAVFVLQQRRLLPYTAPTLAAEDFIPSEIFLTMMERAGHTIEKWTAYEAEVDGLKAFIRDGSQKPKGWQITLRNAFRNAVRTSEGFLLVNRGPGLVIPFSKLKGFCRIKHCRGPQSTFLSASPLTVV